MSKNIADKLKGFHNSVLLQEFYRLKKESINQHFLTANPNKITEVNELKRLNDAKEKIKQQIISADNSTDNSVVYTAITNFGNTNE